MSGQNFSVRTESEKLAEIDAIAKAQDRSRNYVVNEAINAYLAEEQHWITKVKEGLAAAESGDFVSNGEVDVLFKGFEDKAR
ncbi:MAG: ribbon-helix-helix protein, CopG family [Rhodospirillales bacterium]|nr:ribbon-helix-helix protein, CopG family [Rhodospirillales bacterium]